jgi:hypothetical protein
MDSFADTIALPRLRGESWISCAKMRMSGGIVVYVYMCRNAQQVCCKPIEFLLILVSCHGV